MANFDLEEFGTPGPSPPSRQWESVALVVTALAAVFSVVTQAKDKPGYAATLAVAALLVAVSVYYRPVLTLARKRIRRAHRNRVARKLWPKFLGFERCFAEFLNNSDPRNLRYIINDVGGRSDDELFKLCPPDYLEVFYPILSSRHVLAKRVREQDFRIAATEFIATVASYNMEYVLKPMRRFKDSSRFAGLAPQDKQYREGAIEDFRERWVRFLDDFKQFLDTANNDFAYEPYHQAIPSYFERPKKFSL